MKIKFLVILFLVFSVTTASSDWYIIDIDTNRATSKTQYQPSVSDLDSRNEFAVESDSTISVYMAEYRNGKIEERMKTQEEKNKEKDVKDSKDKKDADFESAKSKLIILGLTEDEVISLK